MDFDQTSQMENAEPVVMTPMGSSSAPDAPEDEQACVKRWLERITEAKAKWEPDFQRMRQNQEFVTGLQWEGQTKIRDASGRYTCNLTLKAISTKVAQLYAKNPEIEVTRRDRMEFQIWDESIDKLEQAMMTIQQQAASGGLPPMDAMATMMDFTNGRKLQEIIDRVCKTLALRFQYEWDVARPDFKEQMKQLVIRTVTCGVGYCIPSFVVDGTRTSLSTIDMVKNLKERSAQLQSLLARFSEGEFDENSNEFATIQNLILSINTPVHSDSTVPAERLEFDFPPATSIIPDVRCRNLVDFIAARFVAQEMTLPINEVNAFFGLNGEFAIEANIDREEGQMVELGEEATRPMQNCTFYRIFDADTKTDCYVAKGYDRYLRAPQMLEPSLTGFWPIFAVVFNKVEADPENTKTSIFPPSDVDLIRDAQREWNRTRDALRDQRNANAPTYITRRGSLTENDKNALLNRQPNQIVELEQVPADKTPADMIQVLQVAQIDPALYETSMLEQDIQIAAGAQQADLGPAPSGVTATVGTIAAQTRMTVSNSNIDDLDGFLSRIARAGCEMLLMQASEDSIRSIVGPGAVWPSVERENYLSLILVKIKAGSSGRPNKALENANAQQLFPLMLQAGANPKAIIEEIVKRLDDELDPTKFYPLPQMVAGMGGGMPGGPQGQPQGPQGSQGQPSSGPTGQPAPRQQKPQLLASGQAVPPVNNPTNNRRRKRPQNG